MKLAGTQANETCYHLNCHMGEREVRIFFTCIYSLSISQLHTYTERRISDGCYSEAHNGLTEVSISGKIIPSNLFYNDFVSFTALLEHCQ